MNKKITYILLLVLVCTGIWFFIQMQKLSAKAQNELYNLELPIIVVCMLATGFAMAFPSLLFSGSKEKQTVAIQDETAASAEDATENLKNESKFSFEKLAEGLHTLKTDSIEKRFWFFCEYFKINLACLYKADADQNLKIIYVYGIPLPEEGFSVSGKDSLAALPLQSGNIEVIDQVPDQYFSVQSGLGETKPSQLIFVPLIDESTYVLELASFSQYKQEELLAIQDSLREVVMVGKYQIV